MKTLFTSESVNIGHPDKTCDVIADSFLDEALKLDPNAQMAVECAIKNDVLMIYGEQTTTAIIDYEKIASETLKDIGYKNEFKFIKTISEQSPDINQAVVKDELKANDQGMMFGYATNETSEFMPLPIIMANKLMMEYDKFRRKNSDKFFADAKAQVTVEYENDRPINIHTILVSVSHSESIDNEEIRSLIMKNVVDPIVNSYNYPKNKEYKVIINPSGRFTIWGSFGDSGCVGRKIVVDTYGGMGRVGGGCFSSKNATKVDRSAAYYARYVAKNIVANELADRCEIQVSYAIGLAKPINITINTFGTNKVEYSQLLKIVEDNFDFSVSNIIKELDLLKPQFKETACFGHFGRNEFAWERVKVLDIKI